MVLLSEAINSKLAISFFLINFCAWEKSECERELLQSDQRILETD